MDGEDLAAALTLMALPRAGASAITKLLELSPLPGEALCVPRERVERLGLHPETVLAHVALRGQPSALARRMGDQLRARGVRLIARTEPAYPVLLGEVDRPPPCLFVEGSEAILSLPQIAVVGSRSPTPAGREFAAELAAGLTRFGLAVTSGLAHGIDTAAHRGALSASGITLAVMGTGPDRIYPAANRALAAHLLEAGGALVTEFPPGIRPDPRNFPQRNRIISGLALGVVVVEAGLPSGSLSTATHAAEQGREVMAVPGPVRSPTSRGCHELLRNGAALIETPEDVVRALGDRFKPSASPAAPAVSPPLALAAGLSPEVQRVFAATSTTPDSIDLLVSRTGLAAAEVVAAVVRLELEGLLETSGAGVARRR